MRYTGFQQNAECTLRTESAGKLFMKKYKMCQPEISVLMSVYNETADMLRCAVESVLRQSVRNFEFIIIADNPDATEQIRLLQEYQQKDQRIVIIYNSVNQGLAESLNTGLKAAQGKYIARMDADDISTDTRFQEEKDFLDRHQECDLVCSGRFFIDEKGRPLQKTLLVPKNDECLMKSLSVGSVIAHPTVMMRLDAVRNAGGYCGYSVAQDFDLWLRMKKSGCRFHYIDKPLLYYRLREENVNPDKGIVQFLSSQYAKYLDMTGREFNRKEYNRYIRRKQKDSRFIKYQKLFIEALNRPVPAKILLMAWCFIMSPDCRRRGRDRLLLKRYVTRLSYNDHS